MAHIRMKLYSNCLRRYTHVTVLLPTPTENDFQNPDGTANIDDYTVNPYFHTRKRYRVLYLLHGTHGDDTDWSYYTNLERFLIGTDLMVVCPDGQNSWWADVPDGPMYETYITGELRHYINAIFPARTEKENTFLAGLSMGGSATLNIGYRHPELYSKLVCLSAGLMTGQISPSLFNRTYPWKLLLGGRDTVEGTPLDGLAALKQLQSQNVPLPELYLTCGTEDPIVGEMVQKTIALFQEMGVSFVLDMGPGGHTYEFWSEHIAKAIPWLLDGRVQEASVFSATRR